MRLINWIVFVWSSFYKIQSVSEASIDIKLLSVGSDSAILRFQGRSYDLLIGDTVELTVRVHNTLSIK